MIIAYLNLSLVCRKTFDVADDDYSITCATIITRYTLHYKQRLQVGSSLKFFTLE